MYQNYTIIHQTIREYCSNLGGNARGTYLGRWCIQLKCANWEPYPDRRANHVENSKEDPLALGRTQINFLAPNKRIMREIILEIKSILSKFFLLNYKYN